LHFYVHAIDMVHSSITDVSAAREITPKDYKEFFVSIPATPTIRTCSASSPLM